MMLLTFGAQETLPNIGVLHFNWFLGSYYNNFDLKSLYFLLGCTPKLGPEWFNSPDLAPSGVWILAVDVGGSTLLGLRLGVSVIIGLYTSVWSVVVLPKP